MDVRASYDSVADDYATVVAAELPLKVFDRAMIGAFCELVLDETPGTVVDIGCGPGHLTAYLCGLGLDARGVDLSAGMIRVARRMNPGLQFEVQSMISLTLESGSLAGAVARYSLIHFSDEELPIALGELARVLRAGGYLLIDFQVGDEQVTRAEAYGHAVALTSFRRTPEALSAALELAGFEVVAQLRRAPDAREKVEQCHIIARRPAHPGNR